MLREISSTGQILHDSIYMKHLKYSNSQRPEVEWWFPGQGEVEMGNYCSMGNSVLVMQVEKVLEICCTTLCL